MANSVNEYKAQLKKKYKEGGLRQLSQREILELVLFYSMPAGSVNECTNALLNHFGSVKALFSATFDALMEVPKMTEKAATFIKLIPNMCVQYSKSSARNSVLMHNHQIRDFFSSQFYGLDREMVKLACLDTKLNVIHICTIAGGETSSVMVNARALVSEVIDCGCAGCILGHNHPQGSCSPSNEDVSITNGIRTLLHNINVKLLDHVIVGNDGVWSLKSSGKI